jgi:hypothetical protein
MAHQKFVTAVCRQDGKVAWSRRFDDAESAVAYMEEEKKNVPVHTTLEVWDTGVCVWREEL